MRKLIVVLSLALVCAVPGFACAAHAQQVHLGHRAAKASYQGAKFAGKVSFKAARSAFNFLF